ncbi:ABC transporter ATP-binding protein [Bremerella sp. T1]|uniref:ABC transporter ATP-binding protein n=1 Tax=Bremerella sp. TYQ1 TaxID=3119568 RepID=UPI001CCFC391|nr:polysaccharide ABC transporter ATP-binding protein [Bremerella volcania]UBM36333.1 polysaccharide ABC transporter ATP-binding protein [Bremerella volcania]
MPTRALRKSVDGIRGQNSVDETHSKREVWALKDATFQIRRGEVVGVIGRNGAGKSTLLKILTRITKPTSGRAEIRGRVGSLLEVGTGFHPELSGRENIFFNGVILGMRRQEIIQKFDEIVEFSGVEKFLDTPVKRYSSGMRVRLAFAVAAHLHPEILLIDEVLAVGDAEFQKRCLGKMQDVATSGRTVIFVSHNMGAIQSLCSRCFTLKNGSIDFVGEPIEAVDRYLANSQEFESEIDLAILPRDSRSTSSVFQRVSIAVNGVRSGYMNTGDSISFKLKLRIPDQTLGARLAIGISNFAGHRIFTLDTRSSDVSVEFTPGETCIECDLPSLFLAPGAYTATLYFNTSAGHCDHLVDVIGFGVRAVKSQASTVIPKLVGDWLIPANWHLASDVISRSSPSAAKTNSR